MSVSMTNHTATPLQLDAAFFERLFNDAGLAVFACDADGNVLAWNPTGERLFQSQRGDEQRRDLRVVLPPEHRLDFDENFQALLEKRTPQEFRTRIRREDGEITEYAAWLTPILDQDDQLQCVCVWFNDITARLQLRRSMRKRERLTTLGALAGSVAHHYNNLLCSIATSFEFALNMNTISATRRVLRRTADAVARATHLTQQLLVFAQADHRTSDLADLTEIVLRYFDQHEAELASSGIKLALDWKRIPFVPLPREQLSMVIENIVRNAIEAMPDGGTLTVTLRRRDEHTIVLTIADSGPGILPDEMERLFEPFFTTKGTLGAGATRQAGMGLAVAHGLISEMHGSISVSNLAEGGALFEIVLPLTPVP